MYIALVCIQGIIYIVGRVQSCQHRSCQVTISYCHLPILEIVSYWSLNPSNFYVCLSIPINKKSYIYTIKTTSHNYYTKWNLTWLDEGVTTQSTFIHYGIQVGKTSGNKSKMNSISKIKSLL